MVPTQHQLLVDCWPWDFSRQYKLHSANISYMMLMFIVNYLVESFLYRYENIRWKINICRIKYEIFYIRWLGYDINIYVDDYVVRSCSVMVWMLLSCMCDCMRLRVQFFIVVNFVVHVDYNRFSVCSQYNPLMCFLGTNWEVIEEYI